MDWYALFNQINFVKPTDKKIKQINMLGNYFLLFFHVFCLLCYHSQTLRHYLLSKFLTRIVRDILWIYCYDLVFGDYFHKNKAVFEILSIDPFFTFGYVFDLLSVCAFWVEEEFFDDCMYCEYDFIC